MKKPLQYLAPYLHSAIVSGLIAAMLFAQTAIAQDPSIQAAQQAAQQANDQAMQASQQATQQAMDAAQQANQQAMQDSINNSQSSSSSAQFPIRGVYHPPVPQVPSGPVPARIASAHTVLLTNVGISARLGLDSNRLYNDIHERLEQWGYYQLVSSPQEADLVFQLDEIDPHNGENVTAGTDLYNRTPYFRLVILDAKTGIPLWTLTAPIYITGKKTYAHWMDISEQGLITRLKGLAHQPVSAEEQAALTQYPPTHRGLVLGLAIGIPAAVGISMIFVARHTLNDMKASQDAFCKANNIPANMCAGG